MAVCTILGVGAPLLLILLAQRFGSYNSFSTQVGTSNLGDLEEK